jgi:peptidoglycan hydrolase CwlO-like protein
MSKEDFRETMQDFKKDVFSYLTRLETKIDTATQNISSFTADIAVHSNEIEQLKKDVDKLGTKSRTNAENIGKLALRFMWATGIVTGIVFVLKFAV